MKLTIVDKGTIPRGQSHRDVLRGIIASARAAEAAGYHRYWVAENHHGGCSFSSAELMAATLAGATSRIRVGTAGMLMLYHNPWRVAEVFRLLEALYPGRIDLGVTSGVAGPQLEQALAPDFDPSQKDETFARQVGRLIELTRQVRNARRPRPLVLKQPWPVFAPVRTASGPTIPAPAERTGPPVILLGSGKRAAPALLAAGHGCAFCCRISGTLEAALDVARQYREAFRPSPQLDRPYFILAGNFICGENNQDAARMLRTYRLSAGDEPINFIGSPGTCRQRIGDLLDQFRTDEIALFPLFGTLQDRVRGIGLLAGTAVADPHWIAAESLV